ncbi:putative nuclease HARBI1 [Dendropsophus ebraccatus]|uniref:putative nuclease HARBI1 n=1 Tax=Dendropsophus ebraccatus TaxID=150705 RepID=UPI0038315F8E
MSEETFVQLVEIVSPFMAKKDTVMRAAIPADQHLSATLRFLATGRALQDLRFSTGISASLLSAIIPDWLAIADSFYKNWNLPNCGGAIDGKHVRICQPVKSGSSFYNYKGFFSIILLAIVDANYDFFMVEVGHNRRLFDGGVYERSPFGNLMRIESLHLPTNNETQGHLNFFFVGGKAFPLTLYMLKPYPQRLLNTERKIFNYRLSRARHVVENAFGLTANCFRIYHTAINLLPVKIDSVVLACYFLHNYLRRKYTISYCPTWMLDHENVETLVVTPGQWHRNGDALASLQRHSNLGRPSHDAIQINIHLSSAFLLKAEQLTTTKGRIAYGGESYVFLLFQFKVGISTISGIIARHEAKLDAKYSGSAHDECFVTNPQGMLNSDKEEDVVRGVA